MIRRISVAVGLVLAMGVAPSLAADSASSDNPFDRGTSDRWSIGLGVFVMRFDTSAELDSERLGTGTSIDFEDDTDLTKNQTDVRLDGYWRFARKHRLEFGGVIISRDNTRTLDKEIQYGDTIYDVNAEVKTKLYSDYLKLTYKYSFVRNERVDFGFSAGLSTFFTGVELEGEGHVDGGSNVSGATEKKSVIAPVPVVGLHCEVRMVDQFYFRGSGEIFKISSSGYGFSLTDLRGDFIWYPWKHFGFGAGYNRVKIEVTNDNENAFQFQYAFSGALVYGSYIY